jgi:hypothetical protein
MSGFCSLLRGSMHENDPAFACFAAIAFAWRDFWNQEPIDRRIMCPSGFRASLPAMQMRPIAAHDSETVCSPKTDTNPVMIRILTHENIVLSSGPSSKISKRPPRYGRGTKIRQVPSVCAVPRSGLVFKARNTEDTPLFRALKDGSKTDRWSGMPVWLAIAILKEICIHRPHGCLCYSKTGSVLSNGNPPLPFVHTLARAQQQKSLRKRLHGAGLRRPLVLHLQSNPLRFTSTSCHYQNRQSGLSMLFSPDCV